MLKNWSITFLLVENWTFHRIMYVKSNKYISLWFATRIYATNLGVIQSGGGKEGKLIVQ